MAKMHTSSACEASAGSEPGLMGCLGARRPLRMGSEVADVLGVGTVSAFAHSPLPLRALAPR